MKSFKANRRGELAYGQPRWVVIPTAQEYAAIRQNPQIPNQREVVLKQRTYLTVTTCLEEPEYQHECLQDNSLKCHVSDDNVLILWPDTCKEVEDYANYFGIERIPQFIKYYEGLFTVPEELV